MKKLTIRSSASAHVDGHDPILTGTVLNPKGGK
jgi:hypothetical protein